VQRSLIPRTATGQFLPSPEPSKRYWHQQAQAFKKDACEGVKPSGKPCRRRWPLHVHHIDKDVSHCWDANLKTLCPPCHEREHGKRTWSDNNRRVRVRR
jgi:hypothetical protein